MRFTLAMLPALILTACDGAAPADPVSQWAPPDMLTVSTLVRGEDAVVTVTLDSTDDGVPVYLATSTAGSEEDAGWCPPPLAGDCLDLVAPIDSYGPATTVGGVATFHVPIDEQATSTLWLQAASVEGGVATLSEPTAATIGLADVRVDDASDLCEHGGQIVEDDDGGSAVVCNGADGSDATDGIDGADGATVVVSTQSSCVNGGATLSAGAQVEELCSGVDGADGADGADGTNGADGADGTDGVSVVVSEESAGERCPWGGVLLTHAGGETVVCSGANGADGTNGTNGADGIAGVDGAGATVTDADSCINGGSVVTTMSDTHTVCNGVDGANGVDGTDGAEGASGTAVTISTATACPHGGSTATDDDGQTADVCTGDPDFTALESRLAMLESSL